MSLTLEYLSASFIESSEDERSEKDLHKEQQLEDHTPSSPTNSLENGYDHGMDVPDGRSQDTGVTLCVSRLCAAGHLEVLQWLEAYLLDEARDRTMDGKGSDKDIPLFLL